MESTSAAASSSSSTATRFRFRDREPDNGATDSDVSSVSSGGHNGRVEEAELESMTGKGINRLCTELLEIKAASDEDFHRNIFANYSVFVGILEEVREMETELTLLKNQVLTQKKLVMDLSDGVFRKLLSEETTESMIEETEFDELPSVDDLEAHVNEVSDVLDMLLSENRTDEAIAILEMEEENLKTVQHEHEDEDDSPSDVLMLYSSAISERKDMLTLQLTLVAENPRIAAPELQKTLVGLCRLGDSHLATQLLLKYYHSRLATRISDLGSSKSFLYRVYIRELSKFVFSTVSQAARSFAMLYGETSPYAPELIEWVDEEIQAFVVSFTKYVKSISEISGGLSSVVEAAQFAMSYCSLLETQRLILQPALIKHISPCVDEVLQTHIGHFKKVIGIFTTTDAWVLGRYLVSGILNISNSSVIVGEQPEYCLLTNSGRKFITLVQAITEDIAPLVALQMEGSVLRGLMNLFKEYIAILEIAMMNDTNMSQESSSRISLAESVPQQVSILANLLTLKHFCSSAMLSISRGNRRINSELMADQITDFLKLEVDSCVVFVEEAYRKLRAHFCQRFIQRVVSVHSGTEQSLVVYMDRWGALGLVPDAMPSVALQALFMELRKLHKLSEENVFEVEWLMELSREIIEAIFVWIFDNKEIWKSSEESFNDSEVLNQSFFFDVFPSAPNFLEQFVLDLNFLVETSRHGKYFSKDPAVPTSLMESAFISAGLDPRSDVNSNGWATKAAIEAIQKLLEVEEAELSSHDEILGTSVEQSPEHLLESIPEDGNSSSEDSPVPEEPTILVEPSGAAMNKEDVTLNTKVSHAGQSSDDMNDNRTTKVSGDLEEIESEIAAYDKFHFVEEASLPDLLLFVGAVEASDIMSPTEDAVRSKQEEAENIRKKLENDAGKESPGTGVVAPEDSP